ncbi:uncharacterized protein ACIQIH_017112 [Cyanocitta cristata]
MPSAVRHRRELLSGATLRTEGSLQGTPTAASDLGQGTTRTRTKMKPCPGRGGRKRRLTTAGPNAGPGRGTGASPRGPATVPRERERAGASSASAAGLQGHWLAPPSITAPPPIATHGSAELKAGALGPAWANRVGEGGRRPRRAAKRGGPRWRQWGGPADTALPVPRPRALAAAVPSSARDRGPPSPRGDRAGIRERPAGCGAPASPSSFPPARSPSRDPGAGVCEGGETPEGCRGLPRRALPGRLSAPPPRLLHRCHRRLLLGGEFLFLFFFSFFFLFLFFFFFFFFKFSPPPPPLPPGADGLTQPAAGGEGARCRLRPLRLPPPPQRRLLIAVAAAAPAAVPAAAAPAPVPLRPPPPSPPPPPPRGSSAPDALGAVEAGGGGAGDTRSRWRRRWRRRGPVERRGEAAASGQAGEGAPRSAPPAGRHRPPLPGAFPHPGRAEREAPGGWW